MNSEEFYDTLYETPIICTIKSSKDLETALRDESPIIFILFGDILTISNIVGKATKAGKVVFVHIDLIDGLSSQSVAVDYLARHTGLTGIISTKGSIIKQAKAAGLLTIHRCFILDSLALEGVKKQLLFEYADAIEVLPGVMPKIIKSLVHLSKKPVIASGLVMDKEDVIASLKAGAVAVSSSKPSIWRHNFE